MSGLASWMTWRKVAAALGGAIAGLLLALLLELTGHPAWYFLAMMVGAVVPSLIFSFKQRPRLKAFRDACRRLPSWSRLGLVLLMIALTLGAEWIFDANPRDYHDFPLLLPVIATAILFGFGWAMFTIVVTTLAADYFFALPEFSFVLTQWQDALGLAVFAILGALAALLIDDFLYFGEA
jgi:K+-sensing histidine kinase KdpD